MALLKCRQIQGAGCLQPNQWGPHRPEPCAAEQVGSSLFESQECCPLATPSLISTASLRIAGQRVWAILGLAGMLGMCLCLPTPPACCSQSWKGPSSTSSLKGHQRPRGHRDLTEDMAVLFVQGTLALALSPGQSMQQTTRGPHAGPGPQEGRWPQQRLTVMGFQWRHQGSPG